MSAKTPLLGALRSLFRDVQTANAHGFSVEALREVRAAHAELARRGGVSRRTFLTTAGAAAAATLVPRFSLGAGAPTVVIVGGGIAGLNCALELSDFGIRSTVYEASGRIGGRMFSNNGYWDANQVTEWCGELIDTGHTTLRKLAKRFDLRLDNLLGAQPAQSDDVYYFSGRYYPKTQADRDFSVVANIIAQDAEAAGFPTTFDSNNASGRALDFHLRRGSLSDFFGEPNAPSSESHAQDHRSATPEVRGRFHPRTHRRHHAHLQRGGH